MIFHKQNDSLECCIRNAQQKTGLSLFCKGHWFQSRVHASGSQPPQKKTPPSKHPLGDGKKHPKAPMFDGMDAIACWMAFWKHLWLSCTVEKQGHSSPSNGIACMDMIPIPNLQCTCGDVTSYRYNSRFKDVWIPSAGCASAKKLQCFTAACRAVGGRSWLFGGYLLILTYWRQMPRFWSNPFHKAFNGAYLACSLMEQSQFSVKLCRFRA